LRARPGAAACPNLPLTYNIDDNMSNSKYDWETKLPKMIELYKTGISIPEIYKQIQDDDQGFTPGYHQSPLKKGTNY
jgi:hypothetical protein